MSKRGTRRSTLNKRRKGKLAVFLPWIKRFGAWIGVLALIVWIGAWVWGSGSASKFGNWVENQTVEAAARAGFRVEDILLEGRVHADATTILALVNTRKGDPLFSFNPEEGKELIEKINWVRSAQVERRLPGTIYIRVEEYLPAARLSTKDGVVLIDRRGHRITSEIPGEYQDLLLVSGKGARSNIEPLLADLDSVPSLSPFLKGAQRISDRRWDLTLKNGVLIKLPEQDMSQALQNLTNVHEKNKLLIQDIAGLDLREPDRIIVRAKPGTAQDYILGIKETMNKKESDI